MPPIPNPIPLVIPVPPVGHVVMYRDSKGLHHPALVYNTDGASVYTDKIALHVFQGIGALPVVFVSGATWWTPQAGDGWYYRAGDPLATAGLPEA